MAVLVAIHSTKVKWSFTVPTASPTFWKQNWFPRCLQPTLSNTWHTKFQPTTGLSKCSWQCL